MSMEVIEVALSSEVLAQIDARVGPEHRGEYLAKLAQDDAQQNAASNDPFLAGLTFAQDESEQKAMPETRFHPIKVKGEPVSWTIMRDRGSL